MVFRVPSGRATVAAVMAAGALTACGAILGIDPGNPIGDASIEASVAQFLDAPEDVAIVTDATTGGTPSSEAGPPNDALPAADVPASIAPPPDACISEPAWCDNHCQMGPDNCDAVRQCPNDCPTGETCIGNLCVCQQLADYCSGRCGMTTDNCGNPIDCGNCEGGAVCTSNVCGCDPETVLAACGAQQCGQATNNCNLSVNCGVANTPNCPSGQVCLPDDTCCSPSDATACGDRCGGTVTNSCGQTISCPSTICPTGEECGSNQTCCTPTGCSASCVDNCGLAAAQCCPPDSGASGSGSSSGGGSGSGSSGGGASGGSGDGSSGGTSSGSSGASSGSASGGSSSGGSSSGTSSGSADSGSDDSGNGCGVSGDSCTSAADCCSTACGSGGTCVASCVGSGSSCTPVVGSLTGNVCCYPLTCRTTIVGSSSGVVTPEVASLLGTCE